MQADACQGCVARGVSVARIWAYNVSVALFLSALDGPFFCTLSFDRQSSSISKLSVMHHAMVSKKAALKDVLRKTIWARQLTPEKMARVKADTIEQFVPKGGYVCRKGEQIDVWIAVIEGVIKKTTCLPKGSRPPSAACPPAAGSAKARCSCRCWKRLGR